MNHIDQDGANDEVFFWDTEIKDYVTNRRNKFTEFKLDPNSRLQKEFEIRFSNYFGEKKDIKAADIGCGPFSTIGKKSENYELSIIAVDPLANEYSKLFKKHKLKQPHKIVKGSGETLTDVLPRDLFDYVHMENSLDHCHDPLKSISNAIECLSPDGFLFARVFVNEGYHNHYDGFHKWNFDVFNDQVVCWNQSEIHFISECTSNPIKFWKENINFHGQDRSLLYFEIKKIEFKSLVKSTVEGVYYRKLPFFNAILVHFDSHPEFIAVHGYSQSKMVFNRTYKLDSNRCIIYFNDYENIEVFKFIVSKKSYVNNNVTFVDDWFFWVNKED